MAQHHPSDDILVEYAAGSITSHLALCVSVHLNHCPQCRKQVQSLTEVGGLLLETAEPESVDDALFDQIMERVNLSPERHVATEDLSPLQKWLPQGLTEIPWRRQWFKLYEYVLDIPKRGHWRLTLQKIAAGGIAPVHGHHGREVTVVLQGGFSDEMGAYDVGDFVIRDGSHKHRPRALENQDCICLAYSEAPVRLTGPVGRWLEKFRDIFISREEFAAP